MCSSPDLTKRAAFVAPFLAERIWNRPPFPAKLLRCQSCGGSFFSPRLRDFEEQRLYVNYRDATYVAERHGVEPWYTPSFNDALSDPELWADRRRLLKETLSQQIDVPKIKSILDFGGNRGELVADLISGAACFVYDISEVPPVAGVQGVRSVEECAGLHFDLIINSNVLEHVSAPRKLLAEIGKIAVTDTLCFLEVPFEDPQDALTLLKRAVQLALLFLKRPRLAARMLRRGGLLQMHEHVNFYRPETLGRLFDKLDWDVVASGEHEIRSSKFAGLRILSSKMIWCLARRR